MKKLVYLLLLAIVFIGCNYEEQEKYEMVLTYSIHFQDGTNSIHEFTFLGNDKAKATICPDGTFKKKFECLYITIYNPYQTYHKECVCKTSGQLEIISIKRKKDEK